MPRGTRDSKLELETTRRRILEIMANDPREYLTINEIADITDYAFSVIYSHFRILLPLEFVERVEVNIGHRIKKYYKWKVLRTDYRLASASDAKLTPIMTTFFNPFRMSAPILTPSSKGLTA
jgi:hypothetical protein